MQPRKIRLTVRPTQFVSSDAEIAAPPPKGETVVVTAAAFLKAVALAELKGFRAPRCQFLPSQTARFAQAVRDALNTPVAPPGRRQTFSSEVQLKEFFAQPQNARALARILALVEKGGVLDISDE
jgi:hypothetical protein